MAFSVVQWLECLMRSGKAPSGPCSSRSLLAGLGFGRTQFKSLCCHESLIIRHWRIPHSLSEHDHLQRILVTGEEEEKGCVRSYNKGDGR